MAEEQQQERTEQATPKRREDARKKGDVPRSRELTMTGVMLSGSAAILFLSGTAARRIVGGFGDALQISRDELTNPMHMVDAFAAFGAHALQGIAPLALVLLAAVFLSAISIGGWSFSMKAAAPKFERLNPIKGLKRVFSANSLNELWKAMAKFLLVGAIAVAWLWLSIDELLGLGREPIKTAIPHALTIAGVSLLVVSCGLIFIALADVPFQLWNYQKKIRMTRQEVRDEFKETEGRPEVKSRIRALQQQVAARRMMEQVPLADVVITNPTHFAVALKYDENAMGAPQVVAKGKGLIAARIREIAEENAVPLFSAPPLARALYRSTRLGQEIPAGLYNAVAQVLAYVFQIELASQGDGQQPEPPVPEIDESQFR